MFKKLAPLSLCFLFSSASLATTLVKCERDDRILDGTLDIFELVHEKDNSDTLYHTKGFSAWPDGPSEPVTKPLQANVNCIRSKENSRFPAYVVCTYDNMEADGPKKVFRFGNVRNNNYTITLETTRRSRQDGKVRTKKETLMDHIQCDFPGF